ncbi:hypothetical protein SALBM311S_01352 [Streptomyces alboniger]
MHRRAARVLGRLRPPHPQPLPARCLTDPAGPLPQLQGRGAGEGLHTLPAQLALRLGAGQELGGRRVVLTALHHVQDVHEVLVGAGHPDVEFLLLRESVVRGVRGVRVARMDLLDHAAPAPQVGAAARSRTGPAPSGPREFPCLQGFQKPRTIGQPGPRPVENLRRPTAADRGDGPRGLAVRHRPRRRTTLGAHERQAPQSAFRDPRDPCGQHRGSPHRRGRPADLPGLDLQAGRRRRSARRL